MIKFSSWGLVGLLTIFLSCQQYIGPAALWVSGVADPEICLSGAWRFNMNPPLNFWENSLSNEDWDTIQVPGEAAMQGFAIKHDSPFAYKKEIQIPSDYSGKEIFLRFDGVYSYARVWVNGQYIRDHHGGFTRWDCSITPHVTPGQKALVTLEVTDPVDDISYGSGYAKHPIGGILRDVYLLALPKNYPAEVNIETDLDPEYKNATLTISGHTQMIVDQAGLELKLWDPQENQVSLENSGFEFSDSTFTISNEVLSPLHWNAEHPDLYRLEVSYTEAGKKLWKKNYRIGFREVKVQDNQLLVNGTPVKLRGACRHDIHPFLGRVSTPNYEKKDVLLAKESNMNFIRTSHYPPTDHFLQLCDEYGLYVEDETAVCFVGSHRTEAYRASGASQNDPAFEGRYLSQLEEMVRNHRNHPSVIIWSIGNENAFGDNFVKSYEWVKQNDTSRPVIYSYPGQVPDSLKIYEMLSMHYPDWRGNLSQYGIVTKGFTSADMPMLFDEWAHVACYNNFELKEDPNVRNFWGQSLDSMWMKLFEAEGGLGGAIWGMIDETFMLPEDLEGFNQWWGIIDKNVIPATYVGPCVGYGEWGIIDTWRRKKPEFYATKKAYSPTKIYNKQIDGVQTNQELVIPVHNRFDHTNFHELKITWEYGDKAGELENVHLKPHQKGDLVFPENNWNPAEPLNIKFYQFDTFLVDEYNIQLGEREILLPLCQPGNLRTSEVENHITISGKEFDLDVNKNTGLLENVRKNNEVLIKSGPYINLKFPGNRIQYSTIEMDDFAENWKLTNFEYEVEDGIAHINTKGVYDSISTNFTIQIDENGIINILYKMDDISQGKNIQEAGIKFITGSSFETLRWERNAYFTAYPEGHLGSSTGEVNLTQKPVMVYREKPLHSWEMDSKGFYYFGLNGELPYTNLVRSLKEHIYSYSLKTKQLSTIEVSSDGTQACKYDKIDGKNTLIINDQWDYNSLLWGNYMKLVTAEKTISGSIVFTIH